ncbi:MAG: PAS domain S-box protein [Proteobacteria bacterium]|nr:PAS domain S-box protein [Pseudomonadota bacterium]
MEKNALFRKSKDRVTKGLRRRVIRQLITFVVLVLAVGIAATSLILQQTITDKEMRSLDALAHAYLRELDLRLSFLGQNIEQLSKNRFMTNSLVDPQGRSLYLPKFVQEFNKTPFIAATTVVDFAGEVIYSSSGQAAPEYLLDPNLRTTLAMGTPTFHLLVNEMKLVIMQPIQYYQTTQGAVVVLVDLGAILKEILPPQSDQVYRLYQGKTLLFTANERTGSKYVTKRHQHDKDGGGGYVNTLGLSFEIGMPKSEFMQPVYNAALRLLLLSAVFVVLAILLASRLGNQMAQPILQLCARVRASGTNQNSIPCSPVGTGDELEELALAFDERTVHLLQAQEELHEKNETLQLEVFQRRHAEESLQAAYDDLEDRVLERTRELSEAQHSLTRAQNIAHLGNWDWDIVTNHIWWSDEIFRIFGREPQSFTPSYDTFMETIHPEDRQAVVEAVNKTMTGKQPYKIEHRIILPDGSQRDVLEQGELLVDQSGTPTHLMGTVLDISERKEMERRLRQEEERLTALLHLNQQKWESQEGLTDFALDEAVMLTRSMVGYLHFINADTNTMQLYAWSKKVGEQCTTIPTQHYPLEAAGIWADSVRLRQPVIHNDYQGIKDKKGLPEGHFPLSRHLSVPVFDGDTVVAVVGVGNKQEPYNDGDVRQLSLFMSAMWQKLKRQRLEDEIQLKAQLLDAANDAILLHDLDGNIIEANEAAYRVRGYAKDEFLALNIKDLDAPEFAETFPDRSREMEEQGHCKFEAAHICRDGTRLPLDVNAKLIEVDGRRLVLSVARDIRARKEVEEKLNRFTRELERSNEELQQFAYVASHDLQEPLRKIMAFGDRLKKHGGPSLDERSLDYLERMQNAAGRMRTLIDGLLQFSRITTKGKPFEPIELGEVVREVLSDLEELLIQSNGQVEVAGLPQISGDRLQMRQLFQNLLTNSLKYQPPGEVPTVKVSGTETVDGWAEIRVADNGIGFDEKYLDRIFVPFQRLHARDEYEGTGMGLAICDKIVKRHGGTITARSSVGEGATFIISLPLQPQEKEEKHGQS